MTTEIQTYTFNPYRGLFNSPLSLDEYAHQVIEKGKYTFVSNYEKRLDYTKIAARCLDTSSRAAYFGIQGGVIGGAFIYGSPLPSRLIHLKSLLKILSFPFIFLGYGLGTIQLVAQTLQYLNDNKFRNALEDSSVPLEKRLEYLNQRFFTLFPKEVDRVTEYIETQLSKHSRPEKKESFDRITHKILSIKFDTLERKITPKFAKLVQEDILVALDGIHSYSKKAQETGRLQAKALIEGVADQLKSRLSLHCIASATILLSFTTLTLALIGGITLPITLLLNTIAVCGIVGEFLYEKVIVNKGAQDYQVARSMIPFQKGISDK